MNLSLPLFAAAFGVYLLVIALGAFLRAYNRLGVLRGMALLDSGEDRGHLAVRLGQEASMRAAVAVLRGVGYVATALLLGEAGAESGFSRLILLLVVVALVAAAEIGLTLLERGELSARSVRALAPLVRVMVAPLVPLLERLAGRSSRPEPDDEVADREVEAYVALGLREGIVEPGEDKLLESVIDFGHRIVREVMTPRIDMVALPIDTPLAGLAKAFVAEKFERIPVYRDSVDRIAGIVHVQDLVAALERPSAERATARSIAKPPVFVPETTPASKVLQLFQRNRAQMAIVLDEFGGVSGLVTVEDLLEEIVGAIGDEYESADETGEPVEVSPGVFRLPGRTLIGVLGDLFELDPAEEEEPDVDTVAGLLASELGHLPRENEVIRHRGVRLAVERTTALRVEWVRADRPDDAPAADTDSEERVE